MQGVTYLSCPRCGKDTLHPREVMNALSRRDNETYICSPCGQEEALQDVLRIDPELGRRMRALMTSGDSHDVMTVDQELLTWNEIPVKLWEEMRDRV